VAFPATPLGVIVEYAPNADLTAAPSTWHWTDCTQYVYAASRITITRGKSDRYSSAAPSKCTLSLINNDGRFTPTNPVSINYGRIDINTPMRVMVRPDTNAANDTFTRTVANGWGTASPSGGAWTSTGTAANFSVSSTFGRHTHAAVTTPLYSTLGVSMLRVDITVRIRVNALSTGAPQAAAIVTRWQDASNSNRVELRFQTDQSITVRNVTRTGGSDSLSPSFTVPLTHVAANFYRMRVQTGLSTSRVKVWADGATEPDTWLIDGGDSSQPNNPTAGKVGLWSQREASNTNASATIDFDDFSMVDGPRVRYVGYVDEWPLTWSDESLSQSIVPLTISGGLKRIQSGTAIRSSLTRAHTLTYTGGTQNVVGYWPMEDKSAATRLASGIGGASMLFAGFSPANDSSPVGSDPLPKAGSAPGTFSAAVHAYTSPNPNAWSVRGLFNFGTAKTANNAILAWRTTSGASSRWQVVLTGTGPDKISLQAFNAASEVLGSAGFNFTDSSGALLYGKWFYLTCSATQIGADTNWSFSMTFLDVNGHPTTSTTSGTLTSASLGNVGLITHQGTGFPTGNYTIGHVGVGSSITWGPTGSEAILGHAGESTKSRFTRLGSEENVSTIFGDNLLNTGTTVQTMGVQSTSSMIDQFRLVESTEEGILFDGLEGYITILPRSARRNHAVTMALDVASGHLVMPFNPTYDWTLLRNDVTVTNASGTNVRQIATGPLAPKMVGSYSDSVSVSAPDNDLKHHVNFRLTVGTIREERIPEVTLDLHAKPSLIDSYCDVDVGSRITVAHPPAQMDPTTLDLLVEGYTEVIDGPTWTSNLNCSPSTPWDAFTVQAAGNLGRLDTHDSRLITGYSSGATAMRFAVGPSPYGLTDAIGWSTTATPYDVGSAGERITVTAMASVSPVLVSFGTAAHGNNASVNPGMPASIQNGDVILLLTAIRNTAALAGFISNPGGWSILVNGGNVVLLGQVWDGSFTAPTCAFTGGVAGDTTSAQLAAFRGVQLASINATAVQSNGSAQNIATPSIYVPRERGMVITCGWKQNNWTSVATLAFNTEIDEPSSALGSTQGLVWDYSLLTTATTPGASSFVVTGGVSAISKSFAIALATDVYGATVTRSVNGVVKAQPANSAVSLWRAGRAAR
jgi:hypothetical protein